MVVLLVIESYSNKIKHDPEVLLQTLLGGTVFGQVSELPSILLVRIEV